MTENPAASQPCGEPYQPGVFQWSETKYHVPKSCSTCPVCDGRGHVTNGFYKSHGETWSTDSMTPETCRSCDGKGVVWEP